MDGELKNSPELKERPELTTPERAPEVQVTPVVEKRPSTIPTATPLPKPTPLPALTKDQELQVIERVLEDGLLDVFLAMSGPQRTKFRVDGEALATLVRGFVGRPKAIRPHDLQLKVQAWLKSIGGVDRYWLMQAMKIKTGSLLEEIHGDEEQL
jgi:hypothetical protein